MTLDQARTLISERFADRAGRSRRRGRPIVVTVPPDQWAAVRAVREGRRCGCRFFSFLTAVDWKEQGLEVVARVDNLDDNVSG